MPVSFSAISMHNHVILSSTECPTPLLVQVMDYAQVVESVSVILFQ